MEPNSFLSRYALGLSYEQQGLNTEAISEFQKAEELSPDDAATIAALGHALPKEGGVKDARELLRKLEAAAKESYVPPYGIAVVHAGLGEKAQTLEWLERAFQDRSLRPVWLRCDPRLDSLRQDEKFIDLIRRVGLTL